MAAAECLSWSLSSFLARTSPVADAFDVIKAGPILTALLRILKCGQLWAAFTGARAAASKGLVRGDRVYFSWLCSLLWSFWGQSVPSLSL